MPITWTRLLSPFARCFRTFVSRPWLALLVCALVPVLARLALLPLSPVPDPSIHDEFSQLLLGDTLAHGRLTNPTPAMWRHFESIHIIQRPTYNSMYPPGQGAFLAFGQVVFHEPWAGVEVAIALMSAASYWMFTGWLPRTWALFGIGLLLAKLTLAGFWVDSYISAAVPAIGGALVLGALPQLRHKASVPVSIAFGSGAGILMNTRP
ncbi:MAG: hypothetical protein JO217_04140, partial [Acidobacteriaceae bacterium]|nr:hypothetical protein [Acidobacteriaceae bacterium]